MIFCQSTPVQKSQGLNALRIGSRLTSLRSTATDKYDGGAGFIHSRERALSQRGEIFRIVRHPGSGRVSGMTALAPRESN